MISAPEVARYPSIAPLSGYRNEMAIGRLFFVFLARTHGFNPRTFHWIFREKVVPRGPSVLRLSRPSRSWTC